MNTFQLLTGHWLDAAKAIPSASIHCVVTSPPYWQLRNYKTKAQIWMPLSTRASATPPQQLPCQHRWRSIPGRERGGGTRSSGLANYRNGLTQAAIEKQNDARAFKAKPSAFCSKCNAWRGELGQEPTPQLFIEHLVQVFREVRRVLRPDGTLWIDIGDSYYGDSPLGSRSETDRRSGARLGDLKPKDLVGIPWMLALALRADGWWLRRDNIWHKTACMPESVAGWRWERCKVKVAPSSGPNVGGLRSANLATDGHCWTKDNHPQSRKPAEYVDCPGCDKCQANDGLVLRKGSGRSTTNHEYIFMLAKSDSYYYDSDAVAEPQDEDERWRRLRELAQGQSGNYKLKSDGADHGQVQHSAGGAVRNSSVRQALALKGTRNRRSVWRMNPEPYAEDHFAAFPSELPTLCIKAGTSEHGCCAKCGAPYARVVKRTFVPQPDVSPERGFRGAEGTKGVYSPKRDGQPFGTTQSDTLGWRRTCRCKTKKIVRPRVADPFLGRGTTGVAAVRNHCDFVGCDLQEKYVPMARKNIRNEAPLYVTEID